LDAFAKGGIIMDRSLGQFRASAAECFDAARKTADPVAATTFLLMAEKWIKLADERAASDVSPASVNV
jgi:hypothetical protein